MLDLLASSYVVPYDPAIDTPLGHRNLVLIYVLVWGVQLAYGIFVALSWRASGRRKQD